VLPTRFAPLRRLGLIAVGSWGCRAAPECVATVDAERPTVLHVSWSTREPGASYVEFGATDAYGHDAPQIDEDATEHRAVLYGLPSLTDVYYRAVTAAASGEATCEGTIRTENLPTEVPELEVTISDPDRQSPEPYLLAAVIGEAPGLVAIDREGNGLWFQEHDDGEGGHATTNVDVKFAHGGNELLFNSFHEQRSLAIGKIVRVTLDGRRIEGVSTPWGHHVFTELPDGTLAYPSVVFQAGEHDPEIVVAGDELIEVAPDGSTRTVFSAFDWFELDEERLAPSGFYPGADVDWTHANSLEYYPDTDTYLMSLCKTHNVVEIDRASGDLLRVFGSGGYGFSAGSLPCDPQHDVHWTAEGTLLMTSQDPATGVVGAIEYAVDDATGTLTEVRTVGFESGVEFMMLGQARILQNGNLLMNWGGNGILREFTPEGDVVWEVSTEVGSWFGQVRAFSDFYTGE
jgi:hypothetical protein